MKQWLDFLPPLNGKAEPEYVWFATRRIRF